MEQRQGNITLNIRVFLDYTVTYCIHNNHYKLQTIQNTALYITTGCTLDTNIKNLYVETNLLPLHKHLKHITNEGKIPHTHSCTLGLKQTHTHYHSHYIPEHQEDKQTNTSTFNRHIRSITN